MEKKMGQEKGKHVVQLIIFMHQKYAPNKII